MNRTPMSESYVNSQANETPANDRTQGSGGQPPEPGGVAGTSGGQRASQQAPDVNAATIPQLMCASELTNLLLEFAFSVFVNKPDDIVVYAARYFDQLQRQRGSATSAPGSGGQPGGSSSADVQVLGASLAAKRASNDSQTSTNNSNNTNNEPDEMDDFDCDQPMRALRQSQSSNQANQQPQPQQPQAAVSKYSYNRRKSVFAEHYDPAQDQDEDDENSRVVHRKSDEQRQRLTQAIKSIFIFRSVEPQDVANILDAMFEVRCRPGDIVIRQGDDGDNFYVVERGKFQIYVTLDDGSKQIRGEYEDNGSFGELALMYNQPRAASVVALSEGALWAMDRNTFRRIVLKSAFRKRKEYEALFEKVSVLQCLNGYERMNLCDALESKRFLNGQRIINQGDQANGMYFIESGNVKIVKQLDDCRLIDVAILGKGDYFGELALINHKPRAATVYAIGDEVKLAFLDTKAFERLLGSCIDKMEQNCAIYLKELAHNEGIQKV